MTDPDPYLDADTIRATWPVLDNDTTHSDTTLEALVARFEALVERARGVAYRERVATVVKIASQYGTLWLPDPKIVSIDAVTVDGVAIDESSLDPVGDDSVLRGGSWVPGQQVSVTYTHGFSEPPPGILDACGEFVRAKRLAATSDQPRNTLSYTDDSGYVIRESTANWDAGRYTGLMVVDDAINAEKDYRVPGVA